MYALEFNASLSIELTNSFMQIKYYPRLEQVMYLHSASMCDINVCFCLNAFLCRTHKQACADQPDFQKILTQTYDKILVKITLQHS